MASQRNEVLILDDDAQLLESLAKAFEKKNIKIHITDNPSQAQTLVEQNPIGLIFVDCLLPTQSGVEVVQSMRRLFPPTVLDVVMMSGVFTDPAFVKDAVRETQAISFLKKPFDLEEVFKLVQTESAVIEASPRKLLYQLAAQSKLSYREKRKAIEAVDELHGFDLPFLYNLYCDVKASGFLNIATEDDKIFGVTFAQGCITQVDIPDQETYLGNLLLGQGFVDPADLEFLNKSPETPPKKLGFRLVQRSMISPHALEVVINLQTHIRLAKTLVDQNLKINFVEAETEKTSPFIDGDLFNQYLHDWIASKISSQWLKNHYLLWGENQFQRGPFFSDNSAFFKLPLIESQPEIVSTLLSEMNLNQILDLKKFSEGPFLKAVHLLITKGILVFKERAVLEDPVAKHKMLVRISDQLRGKNKLEVFDVISQIVGTRDHAPAVVEQEFLKFLGSEKSIEKRPEALRVYQNIRKQALEACDFAKKGNTSQIKKEITRNDVEMKLKAAAAFDEAKKLIEHSQYKQAYEIMKRAIAVDPNLFLIKVYFAWSKILLSSSSKNKNKVLTEVEMDLVQISPEEKAHEIYHYVQALLAKSKNDLLGAKKSLERALNLNPNFIAARRELSLMKRIKAEQKDVFHRDLGDLVGAFFKKAK